MECKYVRESNCICFIFHPSSASLFSLVHFKNRLRILQENLYTGLLINELAVPLREENLEVDNYSLCYNQQLDFVILSLSNHILIYSVEQKSLKVVVEAQGKNSPYYISQIATQGKMLYFSASEQKNIYGIDLLETVKAGTIPNYVKFKIAANETQATHIATSHKLLVALCSDNVMRVWDRESTNSLRGAAIDVGSPTCLSFSDGMGNLLLGTKEGFIQAWDGESLGIRNTQIMQQKVANMAVQSVCWFHYSGQGQSHRFLVLTEDSSVKLYSLWFQKKDDRYVGKSSELSLLYSTKQVVEQNFQIQSHSFANFIFFSPGVLLYMVDHYPLIYYPIIVKQPSLSFSSLTPNERKELLFPRDVIYMDGLSVNRVTDKIEQKLSLHNDLEYKELKILKLDMRPNSYALPKKTKLMLLYYLNNTVRVLTISNLNLNEKNESLATYKEYSGSWIMFLGPHSYYEPFLFILQEDKQTITILSEGVNEHDVKCASEEEKRYLAMGGGEIYTKKINIKVNKVFLTPFRDAYVVLYQSDNLLRFSHNINYDAELINYDVCTTFSLRLDYTDIILDVLWTCNGEIGVVLCLDKVVFINSELKVIRSALISGYVVQGQWLGYTLLITTRKDVQYLDVLSKPLQAFCLQNLDSKYLILRVMADRVFGIQKVGKKVSVRARYFNIMEPLVSGYLNYQKITEAPMDELAIKRIIECFSPYYIVSEEFVQLLNQRGLNNFSKYFIEGNEKMFSRPLRAKILNGSLAVQRFIPAPVWNRKKKLILDLLLTYEESKDATDPYDKDKGQQAAKKLQALIGTLAFDSIKDISEQAQGATISNNFGEKSLSQIYSDVNKEGLEIKMEVLGFKAENVGEWLGQFGNYLDSQPYFAVEDSEQGNLQAEKMKMNLQASEEEGSDDQAGQMRDLIVYYRCDDGKGTTVEDLSDYLNNGTNEGESWSELDNEPMELEDKWGKKCPPQFSLSTPVTLQKINTRKLKALSFELWIFPLKPTYELVSFDGLHFKVQEGKVIVRMGKDKKIVMKPIGEHQMTVGNWINITFILNPEKSTILTLLNSQEAFQAQESFSLPKKPQGLVVGDSQKGIEFTQFRLWKRTIDPQEVKENMRTPLEIVFEKRKKLKIKLKEKKKKASGQGGSNPFSMDL